MKAWQIASKRAIDIVFSGVALIVSLPLFVGVAVAIRLDSGRPLFFVQRRLGQNGVPFRMWKFRTMHVGAPDWRNLDGSAYSGTSDPRLTRVGRFLRRTSLDELPQLLCVLTGKMSLVGPRPVQVDQFSPDDEHDKRRLVVKPGLTGLAQINGRNALPWAQRKVLDVRYVEQQSVLLDLQILIKTVPYVLRGRDLFTEGIGIGRDSSAR